MKRRHFIQQTGSLMAVSMIPGSAFSMNTHKKYKMGLQLFSIRDAMEKDPVATLKEVAALGYEDLETYGYNPEKRSYYGYKSADFKQILDDLQLTTSSGHYGFSAYLEKSQDEMKQFVDQCIEGAHALNKKYITWPFLEPHQRTLETFKKLSPVLNRIGEQVNNGGLGFAYHNHDYEFHEQDGTHGYEILLKETDPELVKMQMDMYWVKRASKLTPAEIISKQPGRFVLWHIKDMDKVTRDYTELGNGSIDYTVILPEASRAGLEYYYLEQGGNYSVNSMESIRSSAVYFKAHLEKYLQ
jgi:sugar phosphate isomerase/epimerase